MKELVIELAKHQLRRHEGLRLKAYSDIYGFKTIGYGYNVDANGIPEELKPWLPSTTMTHITIEIAEYLLDKHTKKAYEGAVNAIKGFRTWPISKQAAIVNMIYNIGLGSFLQFKATIEHLEAKEWDDAKHHILNSLYAKQVPKRAKEIADAIAA